VTKLVSCVVEVLSMLEVVVVFGAFEDGTRSVHEKVKPPGLETGVDFECGEWAPELGMGVGPGYEEAGPPEPGVDEGPVKEDSLNSGEVGTPGYG
jgi:hypothetical protein